MLLVTWNVNSLGVRLPRVVEFLELHRPDVLCLQETKCASDAFPGDALAQAGYAAVHHSAGGRNGVALLARDGLPIADPALGLPGELAPEQARWIEATVGGLRIASAYVPNGQALDAPAFVDKLAFLDAMRERAGALDAIVGDFNVAPADVDVYDPSAFVGSTHVSEPERSRLRAILDGGFVDAFRRLHPEEVGYTWWDYRQGHFHRAMGLRIDLVLVRERLAAGLRTCGIDRNFRKGSKPSDHAPLLTELAGATMVG